MLKLTRYAGFALAGAIAVAAGLPGAATAGSSFGVHTPGFSLYVGPYYSPHPRPYYYGYDPYIYSYYKYDRPYYRERYYRKRHGRYHYKRRNPCRHYWNGCGR